MSDALPRTCRSETAGHELTRLELRERGRAVLGVTGASDAPPLRDAIRSSGVGWYPLFTLAALVLVGEFHANATLILGPDITATLGISKGALAGTILVGYLVTTVATLPFAALVERRPRRAVVAIATSIAWSAATLATAFVANVWGLLAVLVVNGAASGSMRAVHEPLLLDSYPPPARVRAISGYRAASALGQVAAPLLVAASTVVFGFTWRAVFLVLGGVSAIAAFTAMRLRDPGYGRWDTEKVREVARGANGAAELNEATNAEPNVTLGFFEISRRVLLIPTIRQILIAQVVVGMMLVPLVTYLAFFLEEEWGMGAANRSLFSAGTSLCAVVALFTFAKRGEEMFREDPARLVRAAGTLLAVGITAIAVAIFTPVFVIMALLFGAALALVGLIGPALGMAMYSVVPSSMRPHVAALTGIAVVGVGGVTGLLLMGGIDRRYGTVGAILSLAVPGIAAGLVLRRAARTVNDDLDLMITEVIEEEEVRAARSSGVGVPLLSCRHIEFSYDGVQVLFDVSLTVDDGEMIALLGTNGAGKSTLLRVISGLGYPNRGSVRLRGANVTFVDPQRRVTMGIKQVVGGRGTFPALTVVENLRAAGYSRGRSRRAIEQGIETSFDAFPRLAERRNQPAAQMSGGEAQMLALSSAFMLQPRLLLIDELSLGLAPKVIGDLLVMVRQVNAAGTAVVLVEQSVNIALSLVEHAYFMEKGRIRFDGPAADLIGRDDLLRSVFLEGGVRAADSGPQLYT